MAAIAAPIDRETVTDSAEMRIAAAARAEVIWTQETQGRIPDASELARAIGEAVRRELVEAQLRAEIRTSRQYALVLERLMPDSRT